MLISQGQRINLNKLGTLPPDFISEKEVKMKMPDRIGQLAKIQDRLFAQGKYSLLVILQGMDASGKDGAVKHVFSGVNPSGCRVKSFKVPTLEESRHDFLWRIHKECPENGMIQIFNRSHYEDVLVPSVHKLLEKKKILERMEDINRFENLLVKNNTILLKFFLHVSKEEQMQRINERIHKPEKRWKYQESDIIETRHREEQLKAYQMIFQHCSHEPWFIIPSDKNWYKNYLIVETILEKLNQFSIRYPEIRI